MESIDLFVLRPTTGLVRHKAFIKVGPDEETIAHTRPANAKNTVGPVSFDPQKGSLSKR